MSKDNKDILVLTEDEKQRFLVHLGKTGIKKPEDWTLVSSTICDEDEDNFDIDLHLKELKKKDFKFAVDVVSNPNEPSALDRGVVKVRYRYVIHPDFSNEAPIKDNTREFCNVLISQDLFFRKEDINIMSFRGVNPIANTRYSIFKLKGHWNCRHAWSREVYMVINPKEKVKDSRQIDKNIIMSKDTRTLTERIKDAIGAFTKDGGKPTKEDIVEVNKILLGEEKFVDVTIGEDTMRIEGDTPEVGAKVSWIAEDGTLSDVPDGEYVNSETNKVMTVKDGMIEDIKDVEAAPEGDGPSDELKEELSAIVSKQIAEILEARFGKVETEEEKVARVEAEKLNFSKAVEDAVNEKVAEAVKDIPAFKNENTKQQFSKDKNSVEPQGSLLQQIANVE